MINAMPKMQPILIETKALKGFEQFKAWMSNRQWVVIENFEYQLASGETLIIPEGFQFDGASTPRWLQWLVSPVGILLIPGLVHDFGYRHDYLLIKDDTTGYVKKAFDNQGQAHWDQVFYTIGEEVNGIEVVDKIGWGLLRIAGGPAWQKNRQRNAPDILPKGYVERLSGGE